MCVGTPWSDYLDASTQGTLDEKLELSVGFPCSGASHWITVPVASLAMALSTAIWFTMQSNSFRTLFRHCTCCGSKVEEAKAGEAGEHAEGDGAKASVLGYTPIASVLLLSSLSLMYIISIWPRPSQKRSWYILITCMTLTVPALTANTTTEHHGCQWSNRICSGGRVWAPE
jgi:hypothetical protein